MTLLTQVPAASTGPCRPQGGSSTLPHRRAQLRSIHHPVCFPTRWTHLRKVFFYSTCLKLSLFQYTIWSLLGSRLIQTLGAMESPRRILSGGGAARCAGQTAHWLCMKDGSGAAGRGQAAKWRLSWVLRIQPSFCQGHTGNSWACGEGRF